MLFERSELEGKYDPVVLGRHSSTSTVSALVQHVYIDKVST